MVAGDEMSWTTCKTCGEMIDTDATPECYYLEFEDCCEIELDYALCDSCKDVERDKYDAEHKRIK